MTSSQKDDFCYEVIAPVHFLSFICECKTLIKIKNVFYRRDQRAAEGGKVINMCYKTHSIVFYNPYLLESCFESIFSDEDTFKAAHFFILSNDPFQCRLFINVRKDITALKHRRSLFVGPSPAEREMFSQRRRDEPITQLQNKLHPVCLLPEFLYVLVIPTKMQLLPKCCYVQVTYTDLT